MELRRKGIEDEVAREALDEIDPDDEVEAARALVRAKLRSVRNLDRDKAVRRLVGMLARKGHSAGVSYPRRQGRARPQRGGCSAS